MIVNVYLISGFLGSGKTTFLNHLLKSSPPDRKLMILMNEFGEEGIDGTLIEDDDLEMYEISKGSIFCSCVKGDFIKALYKIAFTIEPDVLLIESTGVANPSDMNRDLATPLFQGRFVLREKICLVDAEYFLEHIEVFSAVEKQIASSTRIVINKIDLAGAEQLARTKEEILRLNPTAGMYETAYAKIDVAELFVPVQEAGHEPSPDSAPDSLLDEDGLEVIIDRMLEDESAQVTPPDRFISISLFWRTGSLDAFKGVVTRLPSDVVRAKGFIFDGDRPYIYHHVGRTYEVKPYDGRLPEPPGVSRVVFIRQRFQEDDLKELFSAQGLHLEGKTV